MNDGWLVRTEWLLGKDAVMRLQNARVAVFGLGGVGGHCAEALVRAGVGSIDLIDNDVVSESNLNRQLFATRSTLGMKKVEAAKLRLSDIAPDCNIQTHDLFFLPEVALEFDFSKYDYVVDAIDTVSGKIGLVLGCRQVGVPIISSMGAGNKLDPVAFRVADIYETKVCPLAKVMRCELKKRGVDKLKVVYSEENPIAPQDVPASLLPAGKKVVPGSVSFVPSVVGLIIAGEVIKDVCGIN